MFWTPNPNRFPKILILPSTPIQPRQGGEKYSCHHRQIKHTHTINNKGHNGTRSRLDPTHNTVPRNKPGDNQRRNGENQRNQSQHKRNVSPIQDSLLKLCPASFAFCDGYDGAVGTLCCFTDQSIAGLARFFDFGVVDEGRWVVGRVEVELFV